MPGPKKPVADIAQSIKSVVAAEPPSPPDGQAEREKQRLFGRVRRDERFDNAVNWVIVVGVVVIGLAIIAGLVVLILNLLLPQHKRWLTDEESGRISQLLFSGLIGSVLNRGVRQLQQRAKRSRDR